MSLLLRIGFTDEILRDEYRLTLERGTKPMSYSLTVEQHKLRPDPPQKTVLLRSVPFTFSDQSGFVSTDDGKSAVIRFDQEMQPLWEISASGYRLEIRLKRP